jgi:hypothetical protein
MRNFAAQAAGAKQKRINYLAFAQEWNKSADGKHRFYVTTEIKEVNVVLVLCLPGNTQIPNDSPLRSYRSPLIHSAYELAPGT